jgi:glycosyltransferase involved in cell wall biosynthesis
VHRVLWLSHLVPWPATGQGSVQRSHHLLREAARGCEVHLVAVNNRGLLADARIEAARGALGSVCARIDVVARSADRSPLHRGRAVAESLLRGEPFEVAWLRVPGLAALLADRHREVCFDLLHVDTIGLAPYGDALAVPRVLGHHNVESALVAARAEREPHAPARVYLRREARLVRELERRYARDADCNVVVSELDRARLAAIAPGATVHVVPNGVDIGYFAPSAALGHGDGGLVFAGGMDWHPNADAARFFASALWPALRADRPDRRAAWIGRDPPRALAAAADARLVVPGFVEDVRPWLDAASIYLCPIREGGGTRLKVLDALAMAKPLVATALAVEGLGLVEERHYLRAETTAEFVRQVGRLEASAELRRQLAVAGRSFVEARHAWRVVGASLESAWADAIGLGRRAPARASGTPPPSPTRLHEDRCEEADAVDARSRRAPARS